jgi:hypothetical protein
MSSNLASRQPFRSFLCQTACCVESEFTVAETLDGVYSTLEFWIRAFSVQPLCALCLGGDIESSLNQRDTEHTEKKNIVDSL